MFMKNNIDNYIGKLFNNWLVISKSENDKHGNQMVLCECQCGNKTQRNISLTSLNQGRTKSCGCLNKKPVLGKRFGRLVIIKEYSENKEIFCDANCDCGNVKKHIYKRSLVNGGTTSCGCRNTDNNNNFIHGQKGKRIYKLYYSMIERCTNPNLKCYNSYGGRGILVCNEWSEDNGFINFYHWAMKNGYNEKLNFTSIERINVNGNYEPNNCTWIKPEDQCLNKTNSIRIDYKGEIRTLSDILRDFNITDRIQHNRIARRIKLGWDVETAIYAPKNIKYKNLKTDAGSKLTKARELGIEILSENDI